MFFNPVRIFLVESACPSANLLALQVAISRMHQSIDSSLKRLDADTTEVHVSARILHSCLDKHSAEATDISRL